MEFIYKLIFTVLLVLAIAAIAYIVEKARHRKNIDPAGKISFREAMDLVDLPIITFQVGGKKLNFLLDTGANYCIIDSNLIDTIEHAKLDLEGTVYGVGGAQVEVDYVSIDLKYKGVVYADMFQVLDLSNTFDMLKEEKGVNLHGVLGNSFFQKYKYVIDFQELVAYSVID